MSDSSTIVFFPEGAFGPTNNCVGIGDVLRRRGHRVVFIVEESFAGHARGAGLRGAADAADAAAGDRGSPGPVLEGLHPRDRAGLPPADDRAARGVHRADLPGADRRRRYVDDRLLEIIDELQPDLVVEDNVVSFPALLASGRPWARIASCNPAEMKDADVPPTFSGLPEAERADWAGFWAAYRRRARRDARGLRRVLPASGAPRRCPPTTSSTRARC